MIINDLMVISMFLTLFVLLFTGVPIAWTLGGIAVIFTVIGYLADTYFYTTTGLDFLTLGLSVNRIYKIMDNWVLVALPMFIFMGVMLDKSSIAERLMNSMSQLFGTLRGGLAITVTVIGVILAASTGIIGASVVLLTLISLPVMLQKKYNPSLATGTIASAGTLGILIPPSIMLVIMADQVSIPVGDVFMGAVFPGLILAVLYILYILIHAFLKPDLAPVQKEDLVPPSLKLLLNVLRDIIPPFLLVLAVLGSIFMGITTVTEASGVGALGAILLALYHRVLSLKVLKDVMLETMRTSSYIFAIFIGATCFALVLRSLGGDELIEKLITSLPLSDYGIILAILAMVFLLGFLLDWIEITLIILPLVTPIVSKLDIAINNFNVLENSNIVWFVILIAVVLQTSFLTPPVGFAIFYLKGVAPKNIPLKTIYTGIIPFVIMQIIGLIIVFLFPEVVTWFPSIVYAK